MRASWENIARVLRGEVVSDVELAYRLGCRRGLVAQVRADLQLAPMPLPVGMDRMTPELVVMMNALFMPGGHRRWNGRRTRDGVPLVDHFTTAARVVFRMTHGREPEGQVRVGCAIKHCVEGSHLVDRVMREDVRALDSVGGVR
ncbi:hypothetical protein [Streptomyces afghaniensis]|uniref:hypothetical protein n=1 Tax=Streptomyces afghaniensis TaxID=66865 RepID=UPI0027833CBB|nr:hypothetical protein [Streptomyces afghaniensis]MDQ1018804.1 hypothetical protein [Streptomyces afghaniensis]